MFKKLAFCGLLRWLNFVLSFQRLSAILNISSSLTRHVVTHRPAGYPVGCPLTWSRRVQLYYQFTEKDQLPGSLQCLLQNVEIYFGVLHARVFNKQIPKLTVTMASWIVKKKGHGRPINLYRSLQLSITPSLFCVCVCVCFSNTYPLGGELSDG